ncbi:hypothetical protein DL96DRAFT_1455222, partial [Flagelloscypha sp. PMI_526]
LNSASNLPAGWAVEFQQDALTKGEWVGGIGGIQIISYSQTPVDDELIYLPGKFKNPDGTFGNRIGRIYVSSKASVINGRRNWNIPKQLADFKIEKQQDDSWKIEVAHPGSSTPFFKASMKPIPVLSLVRVPSSTSWFGSFFALSCPPIPKGEDPLEVGTDKWATLTPLLKGKASLVRFIPGLPSGKSGDGKGYPNVSPYGVGVALEEVVIDFPVASWL